MKITFIGCGDAFSDSLGNNSALLEFENTNLLIDIPDSNYGRIKNIKKDYSDIENIFITHLHGDHINGLERFAYYRKYATPVLRPDQPIKKPNLYIPQMIYFGLWESVKNGLGYTTDGIQTLEDYFNVILVKGNEFKINGVVFKIGRVNHVQTMSVYSLHVKDKFYYSADSTFDSRYVQMMLFASKCVFHDMHFFDKPLAVHASVNDFKDIPSPFREKLYAMHYDDSMEHVEEVEGIKLVKPYQPILL